MAWLYLVAAIVTEVIGTTSMKFSEGFSKLTPSILVFLFYGLSLVALTLALKRIDVSVAYAVWSGLGTAMIAAIGLLIFKEPLTLVKMLSLLCIIAGVIGLNAVGGVH
jgi:small multidrug resistance pump